MRELFETAKQRYGENIFEPDNQVVISGKLGEIKFSHIIKGKRHYSSVVETSRFSEVIDEIPIVIAGRYLNKAAELVGKKVKVIGLIRSRNYYDEEMKRHLQVYVYVRAVEETDDSEDKNIIFLGAYICKPTILRTTPQGKEIADVFLAVNRESGENDYIPCIVWYEKAKAISKMEVGTRIEVFGRLQSREYYKKLENGEKGTKVAYELCIFRYEA